MTGTKKYATNIVLFIGLWALGLIVVGNSPLYGQSAHSKSVQITKGAAGQKIVLGKATHYSRSLEGTKTAIGTRYQNHKMTAASNFFKLRTWVKVTRLSNGRSVTVYINDRMHPSMASKGRVIDLSIAAAEALRFMGGAGVTRVRVEEIPKWDSLSNENQPAPAAEISAYDR